jgi:4-amino-4-deoxy-L-arabinose transferase-like glycosyltransferase
MRLNVWVELLFFCLILTSTSLIAYRFLEQRGMPAGDEGTWMAPAARVLNGEGFTTNWLVKQDLVPYSVPRPDDLRFPGLVYTMALAFFLFGKTYSIALGLMFAIHIGFLSLTYFACRRYFGPTIALLTLLLTGISPLQLLWNTHIYTESLFGLILAAIILWTSLFPPSKLAWWIGSGLGIGLLGLVKIHAILFLPGFLIMYWIYRKETWCRPYYLFLAISLALLVLSPWLYRNYILFGSPLHSAQNAWIFRYTLQDPPDLGMAQFIEKHGPLVFFKKLFMGIKVLILNWDEYDHGLGRIPLLLALVGFIRRRTFFNPLILSGFLLVFLGSAYTSYPFWIGIRFWTPLIPFFVAYGLFQLSPGVNRVTSWPGLPSRLSLPVWLLIGIVLTYPAFYPLKFYLRQPKASSDHGDRVQAEYILKPCRQSRSIELLNKSKLHKY